MLKKFDFKNQTIRMEKRADGHIWVCLTDMAKASDKLVGHWIQLKSTQEFLTTFESIIGITIMESNVGGSPETTGTWAIQEVALEFAGWCSVDFKIWMLAQIKTLVNEGQVSIKENNDFKKELENAEIERLKLEIQNLKLEKELNSSNKMLSQAQDLVLQNQKIIQKSFETISVLEEEKMRLEIAQQISDEINQEHPLAKNLYVFAALLKTENYHFPSLSYTVRKILDLFPIHSCTETRFANLCSSLYWLNKNKKPNETGVYKYHGDDLIYPCLILFKQENYDWLEIKERIELDYKIEFPNSNRQALKEIFNIRKQQALR